MPFQIFQQTTVSDDIYSATAYRIGSNGSCQPTIVIPNDDTREFLAVVAVCIASPVDQNTYVGGPGASGLKLHIPSAIVFNPIQYYDTFKYIESQSLCQGEVWFEQLIIFGITVQLIAVSCGCGVIPRDIKCGCDVAKQQFAHKTSSVHSPINVNTRLCVPDPNRVSIVLSASPASVQVVQILLSNSSLTPFLDLLTPFSVVLPYRDYGPLITGELWIANNISAVDVTVAEVYRLPT